MTSGRAAPGDAVGSVPAWLTEMMAEVVAVPASWFSAYVPPPGGGRRQSAVLILFGPGQNGSTHVVLTQRAKSMRNHPGQVSFPGGGEEPADASSEETALREANEEIGLDPASVRILGRLPALHIPVSGYDVTPVVAWWDRPHPVRAREPAEVERVASVPVDELLAPSQRFSVGHPSGYVGPAFAADGMLVWGFTAGLLDRMFELAGVAQGWDRNDVRPLPE